MIQRVVVVVVLALVACGKSKEAKEREEACKLQRTTAAKALRLAIEEVAKPQDVLPPVERLKPRDLADPDLAFAAQVNVDNTAIEADARDQAAAFERRRQALVHDTRASLEAAAAAYESDDGDPVATAGNVRGVIEKFDALYAARAKELAASVAGCRALVERIDARLKAGVKNDDTRQVIDDQRKNADLGAQLYAIAKPEPSGVFDLARVDVQSLPEVCGAAK
jgi:hypothetical protein